MSFISRNPKHVQVGISMLASALALGTATFGNCHCYWDQAFALNLARVLELSASGLFLFGIFKAEMHHKAFIMLSWLGITMIVFVILLLALFTEPYVGEIIYLIITEALLIAMMMIVYKYYVELTEDPMLSWTPYFNYAGLQLSQNSVKEKSKDVEEKATPPPPAYTEQSVSVDMTY